MRRPAPAAALVGAVLVGAVLPGPWSAPARAQLARAQRVNSAERVAAFARLPDWTGLWEARLALPPGAASTAGGKPVGFGGPQEPPLPYNAQWQGQYAAFKARLDAVGSSEQIPDTTVTRCIWGVPRIFQGPYQFDVLVTPGLTVFSYDVGEYRRIWTDGRGHPPAGQLHPTNMGHSIGHWEGQTLVIDTVGLRADIWVNPSGATLSERTHVVERWSLKDQDHLSVVATVEDPLRLARPYQIVNTYGRVTDTHRMVQQACYENVREVQEGDHVVTKFAPEH